MALMKPGMHVPDYLSVPLPYDGSATFAVNPPSEPFTLDGLLAAAKELESSPKNDLWIVIDPSGSVFTGTIGDILPSLLAQHPLLKRP